MKKLSTLFKTICGCSLVFLSGCNNGDTSSTTGGDYADSPPVSAPAWHQIKTPEDTGTIDIITAHDGKFFIASTYNLDNGRYASQLYMTKYGTESGAHPEANPAWTHIYFTDEKGNDEKVNLGFIYGFNQMMVAPAIKNGQYIESTNYLYFVEGIDIGAIDFTYDESNTYESYMVRPIYWQFGGDGNSFMSVAYQKTLGIYSIDIGYAQPYASMSPNANKLVNSSFTGYETTTNCSPFFPRDASSGFSVTDANDNAWFVCGNDEGSGHVNLYVCPADKITTTYLNCIEADNGGFIGSVVADKRGFVYVSWVNSSSLITYYYNNATGSIYTKAISAPGSTERLVVDDKDSVLIGDFNGSYYTYSLANLSDIGSNKATLQQVGNNIPALEDIQVLAIDSKDNLLYGYDNDNRVFWLSLDDLVLNPASSVKK